MAKKLYEESDIQGIAEAIREKNGTTNTYKVSEMKSAVLAIDTSIQSKVYAYNQIRDEVKNYLETVTYDPSDYSTSQITNYYTGAGYGKNYPIGADVVIGQPGDMVLTDGNSKIGFVQPVLAGEKTIYNSTPGAKSLVSIIADGKIVQAGLIVPTGALRMIYMPGCVNVRDLGGWACDGGTVKYGKLFRGGQFTEESKNVFVNQLGIRHELNLRGASEAANSPSPVWDGVGVTAPENCVWYSISNKETWKEILNCVFDNVADNKPLYFHCAAGADRTGTVACILEAILGVGQSDIDKDYELTTFYSGIADDNSMRRRNESEWQGLINQINEYSGDSFRDRVINFAVSCGIPVSRINAFRAKMIEGTPEEISGAVYSVTNELTNVNTDNSATEALEMEPYVANLTPESGFIISSVVVTMGGKDITSDVFSGDRTNPVYNVLTNMTNAVFVGNSYVKDGEAYTANINAADGYSIDSVTITMGGTDMSEYYSNGIISIPAVTGDIVITATAIETVTEVNKMVVQEENLNKRISGTSFASANGCFAADPIAVDLTKSCPAKFKGFAATMGALGTTASYGNSKVALLDSSNTILAVWYIGVKGYSRGWACPISGDDCVGDLSTIFDYNPAAGTMPTASDVAYVQFVPQLGSTALTMADLEGLEIRMKP